MGKNGSTRFIRSSDIDPRHSFMYKRCSCAGPQMAYWLSVAEFRTKLDELILSGVEISDEIVLPIMEEIYEAKRADKKQTGFAAGCAKRGINQIKKAIELQNNSNLAG